MYYISPYCTSEGVCSHYVYNIIYTYVFGTASGSKIPAGSIRPRMVLYTNMLRLRLLRIQRMRVGVRITRDNRHNNII